MDIKRETITVNETVMRANEKVLVSGDIIVPDVKSDMAKVLKIDADAVVESCNYTDGGLEADGKIYLTILYVPENDSKPVCSIVTDMPFETRIEDSRLSDGVKCICSGDVFNIEFNMLNSRKLSVKTVVDLKVRAVKAREEDFIVSMEGEDFEKCDENASVYSPVCFKNIKFTADEVLDFPSGKPSGVSLLKTDVKLLNYRTHIVTGRIVIKGVVESCTLYVSDAGKLEFIVNEIPFTEVIDADEVTEKSFCDLNLSVCTSSSALKADSDGDLRMIELEMLFAAELMAYEQGEISLISDCFSCGEDYECEQKSINLEKLVHQEEIRHNLKGSMSPGESMPPIDTVYNLMVKPYVEQLTAKDGAVSVEGSCDCYVLYLSDKESSPVCSVMANIPFAFEVPCGDVSSDCVCSAAVQLSSASYNITISGEIEIRAAVDVCLTAVKQYSKDFVCNIKKCDEPCEKRHGIVVYFTKKGDSLWKIAKKYKVSLKKLIELNKPENPDLIYPGQPILIPMP